MKIKHILLLVLLLVLIYFDYKWYKFSIEIENENVISLVGFWFIHVIIGIFLLGALLNFLRDETYFFESINKLLNKKL